MFSKLHFKVMSCFANLKSKSQTYSIYNLIRHRKSRKSLKNVPGDRNLFENVLYVFVNKIIISALDIHFDPFKSLPEPGKQRKSKHIRRKGPEDKKMSQTVEKFELDIQEYHSCKICLPHIPTSCS